MDQEASIKKLIETLQQGNVMLFTGAGFSLGAQNSNGENLPTGNELKARILLDLLELKDNEDEYLGLINEKLSDIVTYCKSRVGEDKVTDFLTQTFKDCAPAEYHKIISQYKWKRVYTTNIDDVFENAAPKGMYTFQNMRRLQRNISGREKIDYFKMHGCVRNPSGGYVFGNEDYEDEIVSRNNSSMNSYALDIQTNNFVFIGFDDNEIDLNTYLKQYNWRTNGIPNSKLFFINPNPSLIFKNKVEQNKGILLQIDTAKFAEILTSLSTNPITKGIHREDLFITGFNLVNSQIRKCIKIANNQSRLMFGEYPTWNDICFNWDCKHPSIDNVLKYITEVSAKSNENIIVSLYGCMLNGKSVFLKRIGYELVREDYLVYEIARRDFSLSLFLDKCSRCSHKKIALLVDNAPFFYTSLADLSAKFPDNKQLVIITVGRTYFHKKQQYAFRLFTNYHEVYIDPFNRNDCNAYAKEINQKLFDKGLLGHLQNIQPEERIKEIIKYGDVCTLFYSLTDSVLFKAKFLANYKKLSNAGNLNDVQDVLLALAIFQELDIPSFPLEILAIWKCKAFTHTINVIKDYIRYTDSESIALRNSFITKAILNEADTKLKIKTITDILINIASQRPAYGKNIWSLMQEKLMGCRTLNKIFHLSLKSIQILYNNILQYYNTDYNYWIQVGITDQEGKDYIAAHNHLSQAESLYRESYLVRHAMARNYLLRALDDRESLSAPENYSKGKNKMLHLINEREGDQTKAYSIHSYVNYSIKYWKKYDIRPTKVEIAKMLELLNTLNKNGQNDVKTAFAEQSLNKFLREKNIQLNRTLRWDELESLKNSIIIEGIDYDEFIADEMPD